MGRALDMDNHGLNYNYFRNRYSYLDLMIESIFFSLSVLAILWEILVFKSPSKASKLIREVGTKRELTIFERNFLFLYLGYSIWAILGLLTDQWYLFLILLLMGMSPIKSDWYLRLDSFISIIILIIIFTSRII